MPPWFQVVSVLLSSFLFQLNVEAGKSYVFQLPTSDSIPDPVNVPAAENDIHFWRFSIAC